jgi:Asp-tRNA(Asn)/Glu-tRNA(Gln) amidotransferase A subunit family amidase
MASVYTPQDTAWPRRRVLKALSALGVGSAVFGRALLALAEEKTKVSEEMIRQAEWVAGVSYTDAERKLMLKGVNGALEGYAKLRGVALDNGVPPALWFHPDPMALGPAESRGRVEPSESAAALRPASDDDLAFAPITELAGLIRSRQISSVELTRLYLERLRRFDPLLRCVITYTEELAMQQAERADRELTAGRYRGPLHGIPWGVKDLMAVPGYRTTWGAMPYKDQVRPEKATVVARLEEAGAVLLAKLSVGALAWGDVWFDATTKNPWNLEQGSSGSSAGSAASTAAGLVGFALGTETWGSIVSPCTRCGATGLRPTFGRVSRYGAMALAWSMDKIGAIARSVEDCALVFGAIHGADGLDPSVVDRAFHWPPGRDVRSLRVGYVEALFDEDRTKEAEEEKEKPRLREWQQFDQQTLDVLRKLGLELIPITLPARYPVEPLELILTAEATAAFDELTRSAGVDQLVRQEEDAWPNVFRQGELVPAVEYIRANRIRMLLLQAMEQALADVDVYVTPSYGGSHLLLTNLTGHPCVVLPNGFASDGTPTSITFMGKLYGETNVLALARAYQQATDFHLRRPPLTPPKSEGS